MGDQSGGEPLPNTNTNISMTEEIVTAKTGSRSDLLLSTKSNGEQIKSTEKGDLSRTLSFEKDEDDETSSTVSFDSDGLPVHRSRHKHDSQSSALPNNSTMSEGSANMNISGSKAYQDMYRESLMSPVHEDIDDDEDGLEDLLGESIGIHKKSTTEQ